MSKRKPNLLRVAEALVYNSEDFRKAFKEECGGMSHNSLRIDLKLNRILDDAFAYDPLPECVEVPLYLLFALMIRHERGTPKPIRWEDRLRRNQLLEELREELREKLKQRKPGESPTDVLHDISLTGAKRFNREFRKRFSDETIRIWLTDDTVRQWLRESKASDEAPVGNRQAKS